RDFHVTGVQTCALPICVRPAGRRENRCPDRRDGAGWGDVSTGGWTLMMPCSPAGHRTVRRVGVPGGVPDLEVAVAAGSGGVGGVVAGQLLYRLVVEGGGSLSEAFELELALPAGPGDVPGPDSPPGPGSTPFPGSAHSPWSPVTSVTLTGV